MLLIALMAAACLLPGSAFAVEPRPLVEGFGPDGTSATSFSSPAALAFDQGNKRLYALDKEAGEIYGFDESVPATHTPLGGSFPLSGSAGEFNGIATDNSSHNLYYASPPSHQLSGFSESGVSLPGFPVAGQNYACGTAVDSAGNIWLADGNEGLLREYSPAGALLSTINIGGEPCNLAFDSNDNLYVAYFFGGTKKFTASSGYTESTEVDSETTFAITVDQSTDELYVVHFNYVSVYDSSGTLLYEFGAAAAGEFAGIALDEATEEVYVSDYGHGKVQVFGPPLSLPQVATGAADGVTATEATLHGTVNPEEQPLEDCHFQVVPRDEFAHGYEYHEAVYEEIEIQGKKEIVKEVVEFLNEGSTKPQFKERVLEKAPPGTGKAEKNLIEEKDVVAGSDAPCSPAAGTIPADSSSHAVSAQLSGLTPATLYHYRLRATSPIGEAKGPDRVFSTGALAPLIEEQSVEAVGTSDATVSALINPRGGETTYHLDYGTTNAYGQSTSETLPFGSPTDTTAHEVRVHIGGLAPGTAYHFRFVATNPAGVTQGADATLATYPTQPTFGACPNDRFRTGFGSHLPDCRAYEQVSPTDKHGANVQVAAGHVAASTGGDRVTFFVNGGLPTTGGNSDLYPYLASRGPNGWSSDGIQPPTDPGFLARIVGWSEDLSSFLTSAPGPGNIGQAFYLRDSATANFQMGPASPGKQSLEGTQLYGYAADTSHLAFTAKGELLPGTPTGKYQVYDLDHGDLTLASRVPSGSSTVCDDEAGPACVIPVQGAGQILHEGPPGSISRDGSRIVFYVTNPGQPPGTGRIYIREDGTKTTWISASQRSVPDPGGEKPATLVNVTPDGSKVFFLSCEKLTADSTAVSNGTNTCTESFSPKQGKDLYSYDVESGELTDLTVDPNAGDPLGADVLSVTGVSDDGSYVYFLAGGVLAPDASLQACAPIESPCNLYAYHDGVTKFIARLFGHEMDPGTSRVSADGTAMLFGSTSNLTGYEPTGKTCGSFGSGPCNELYRYSAPDEELVCVSCNPTGARPTGKATLATSDIILLANLGYESLSRNLSANGDRAFFESPDPLLPGDTNGVRDVYEWEAQGSGSCNTAGGCIYLLSDGTGEHPSSFVDASANGDHVFVKTNQQLVPRDEDQLSDVYDVGVNAGVAAQHSLTPPTCTSTACQANPPPPPDQTLSSASFSGPGNLKEHSARKCPKGKRKVRRGAKVHCQAKRKQHKRHDNRGGSK